MNAETDGCFIFYFGSGKRFPAFSQIFSISLDLLLILHLPKFVDHPEAFNFCFQPTNKDISTAHKKTIWQTDLFLRNVNHEKKRFCSGCKVDVDSQKIRDVKIHIRSSTHQGWLQRMKSVSVKFLQELLTIRTTVLSFLRA